jgi:hypothetical protein
VAGALALLAMTLFGTGAAILAMVEWRRARAMTAAPVPAGGPAGGPAPAGAPAMYTAAPYADPYAAPYAAAAQPTWQTPPTAVREPAREAPTVAEAPAPVPESAGATPVASRRRFRRRPPEAPSGAATDADQTPPASEL